MPERRNPRTIGEQLRAALDSTGVSQRDLGRRLAEADGGKLENRRRYVRKLLKNEVKTPEPESLGAIETALGLDRGHFVPPSPAQVKAEAATTERNARRLEELSAVVDELATETRQDLVSLAERILALEQISRPRTGRGGP